MRVVRLQPASRVDDDPVDLLNQHRIDPLLDSLGTGAGDDFLDPVRQDGSDAVFGLERRDLPHHVETLAQKLDDLGVQRIEPGAVGRQQGALLILSEQSGFACCHGCYCCLRDWRRILAGSASGKYEYAGQGRETNHSFHGEPSRRRHPNRPDQTNRKSELKGGNMSCSSLSSRV